MNKIRVNYIFRKRGIGHNSIEELFQSIIAHLPKDIDAHVVELPYAGASVKAVLLNIWHVLFMKGILHVTGDVYYIGLIPFKNTILTVHDIKFIKGSLLKKIVLNIFWLQLPGLFANKITIVSNFSKEEYLKLVSHARKKIEVIYNPVNPILKESLKSFPKLPSILHLGTKKNKNIENTIIGLRHIRCKLLIIGPLSQKQIDLLKECKVEYENYKNLNFSEIKQIYERSDIVSFISLYEGFGMPIIEANRVGRVVLTSQCAAIPEIASKAVLYVDPHDVGDIHNGFQKLITDSNARQNLINLGLENAKRFEINTIVLKYLGIYNQLVN